MSTRNAEETADPVFAYMRGQIRSHHPALVADFEERSALALARLATARDVAYGSHPRERLDVFDAGEGTPVLAYFHAGYWQSRDKAQFQFIAAPLLDAGVSVALANYPLCPEVDLADLVESARRAIGFLSEGIARDRGLVAAGHSAGGHLAVELAATDWRARGRAASPVAGVFALSGVYDLEPLLKTPLNDKLRLDAASARACSPLHRNLPAGLPPAAFVVGGDETEAFVAQSRRMHEAWQATGADSRLVVAPGRDHMTLLEEFGDAASPLRTALAALVDQVA